MNTRWLPLFSVFAIGTLSTTCHAAPQLEPTHRQVDVLAPTREKQPLTLHTFVLDREGNLVAGVSPASRPGDSLGGWIQVYSPEKSLIREFPLSFAPTALSISPDGTHYLAAGAGKLWKGTPDGKTVAETTLFAMLGIDPAKLRQEAIDEWIENQKDSAAFRADQVKSAKQQLARLLEKPEAQRSARDKSRIQSVQRMIEAMASDAQAPSESEIAYMLQYRMRIPSLSALDDGAVVTLARNRSYEVWRVDGRFANPRVLVNDLRGCCGQMDLTTQGESLFIAENTKFQVGIYDLNGKRARSFGERYQSGNLGFGSCCNPMNVLCCSNGDLITAESSIGHLKRFRQDGTLLSIIGRARIGGGCKHVALGFDEKRNRHYVQYQDRNHICILVPNAEAAPLLAKQDERERQAEAALQALAGSWVRLPDPADKEAKANSAEPGLLFYGDEPPNLERITIKADRSLDVVRGDSRVRRGDTFRRWHPIAVVGDRIEFEIEEADGYVDFAARLKVLTAERFELEIDGRHHQIFERQPR